MGLNIARFDLVSVQLVVLCAETGSLSAATKRVHCSVSAGSQRLSAIERALQHKLFVRDHNGLRITEAGALFVDHGRCILEQIERMKSELSVFRPDDRRFDIL